MIGQRAEAGYLKAVRGLGAHFSPRREEAGVDLVCRTPLTPPHSPDPGAASATATAPAPAPAPAPAAARRGEARRGEAMAKVSVLNVAVLENPSPFHSPFRFEISFECSEALADDLEWKIIYVGSAESEEFDQILDSVLVGPVPAGRHMFVFQADAPNPSLIPETDAVGVTVVLITCTYHGQEFIRVGYYVNNEYLNPELRENPPMKPDFSQLQRNILASNPRVTRFHINWDNNTDRLEAIETQDPSLGCSLPLNCTPIKGLGLPGCIPGLLPENSMDCI